MSAAEEEPRLIGPVPEPHESEPTAPESILGAVQEEWSKQAAVHSMDYEIPGSGSRLVLRLGPIPSGTLGRLRQRLDSSRAPERDVNLNADVLIAACTGIWGRSGPGADLVELGDDDGPYGLDLRLAAALPAIGKPTTARAVVYGLFGRANSPALAIVAAGSAYFDWAGSADDELSEALLGES